MVSFIFNAFPLFPAFQPQPHLLSETHSLLLICRLGKKVKASLLILVHLCLRSRHAANYLTNELAIINLTLPPAVVVAYCLLISQVLISHHAKGGNPLPFRKGSVKICRKKINYLVKNILQELSWFVLNCYLFKHFIFCYLKKYTWMSIKPPSVFQILASSILPYPFSPGTYISSTSKNTDHKKAQK